MKSHKSSLAGVLLLCGVVWGADPDAATLFRQAQTAYKQQNYAQALSLLRTMQEKYPDSKLAVRGWEYIAQCENALGDPMAAFEAYQKIWERHKDFAQLSTITRNQMKIGNYFLKNKEYKNAITVYEKILENAPHSDVAAGAQYSLAQAYLGEEDYNAARAELAKVIRNYPSSQLVDDAMFDLGYVAYLQAKDAPYDQGATSEAIAAFRTFISNFPSSPKVPEAQQHIRTLRSRKAAALFRTAEFYENVRVPKAAHITYREVIEQYPDTTYADEARRRLEGAERRPVSALTGRSAAALYDDTQAARAREAAAAASPRGSAAAPAQVTPVTVRPSADAQRIAAQTRAAETLRQASAQRVAQLKNDPAGREALRATMKEAYMEELKRARATKALWHGQQSRTRTAAQTPGPEPLSAPAPPAAPRTVQPAPQPALQPAGEAALSAPIVASTGEDEFDFEVRSDEGRIDIAPEPAEPAETIAPAPATPRRSTPRMIIERGAAARQRASASAAAPPPPAPPATPIEGPSFDDILAGRVRDDETHGQVTLGSDWQPFASQTASMPPPATRPATAATSSDFIVLGTEPLSTTSAPSTASQPAPALAPAVPAQPRTSQAAASDFIVVGSEPAAATSSPTAPAAAQSRTPAPTSADVIVVGDNATTPATPALAAARRPSEAPARTLLSEMLEQPAEQATPAGTQPAVTAAPAGGAQARPRSALGPREPEQPVAAGKEAGTPPIAQAGTEPARPARASMRTSTPAPTQAASTPAVPEPAVSDAIERARREEQARAAAIRRRVETVREQATREERTVRQISADGRVRRAQYDVTTTAASDTAYNVDQLQREYAGIYYLIKRGDAALQQGLHSEAKQNYGNALDRLLKLKETAPTWQSEIVNYRIDYCRERMRSAQ